MLELSSSKLKIDTGFSHYEVVDRANGVLAVYARETRRLYSVNV